MNNSSVLPRRIALFSDIFNPLTAIAFSYFLINLQSKSLTDTLGGLVWPTVLMVIPTLVWIFYNVKTGRYATKDVSDRRSRKSLYWFVDFTFLVYLSWAYFVEKKPDPQLLAVMLLFVLMQISNYFIKSSMHTAFNLLVAVILWRFFPWIGGLWFVLTLLVAASRVYLKKHTWPEIISGSVIAAAVGLFYLNFLSLK